MIFDFFHLSGSVVQIDDGLMTIAVAPDKKTAFSLDGLKAAAAKGDAVNAIFGFDGNRQRKSLVAFHNLTQKTYLFRPSRSNELVSLRVMAAVSAAGCVAMLLIYSQHFNDLFSAKPGLLFLLFAIGWVYPVTRIERLETAQRSALRAYTKSIFGEIAGSKPAITQAPSALSPFATADVEFLHA